MSLFLTCLLRITKISAKLCESVSCFHQNLFKKETKQMKHISLSNADAPDRQNWTLVTIFLKSLLDQISDAVPSGFVNYLIRRIHDRNRNLKKTQLGNKKPYSTIFLFRIISIPSKVCYFRLPDHVILMEC